MAQILSKSQIVFWLNYLATIWHLLVDIFKSKAKDKYLKVAKKKIHHWNKDAKYC